VVAGSNPATPTIQNPGFGSERQPFDLWLRCL